MRNFILLFCAFLVIACESEETLKEDEETTSEDFQIPEIIEGSMTFNGITYKTITIEEQTWLAENFQLPEPYGVNYLVDSDKSHIGNYSIVYKIDIERDNLYHLLPDGWRVANGADFATLFAKLAPEEELTAFVVDPNDGGSGIYPFIYYDKESLAKLLAVDAWDYETTNEVGFNLFPGSCIWSNNQSITTPYSNWVRYNDDPLKFRRNLGPTDYNGEFVDFSNPDWNNSVLIHLARAGDYWVNEFKDYPPFMGAGNNYNLVISAGNGNIYLRYKKALKSGNDEGNNFYERGVVRLIKE